MAQHEKRYNIGLLIANITDAFSNGIAKGAIRRAAELDANLVIFPEGTRSKDGKVGKGKTGVALVAAVAQTKVVPVGINFEGKLKFRKRVVVRYGKPIEPKELGITSTSPRDLKKIKSEIMENIVDLVH